MKFVVKTETIERFKIFQSSHPKSTNEKLVLRRD